MIFRFDDVSINSDVHEIERMIDYIHWKGHEVIVGISPIVTANDNGRVFPAAFSAMADNTVFYTATGCGVPKINRKFTPAGHGLIHCDHRLLPFEAQEMSIVSSCGLAGAKIFIPPFNKWDRWTERVCRLHGIELIKFEDGWRSCEHNEFQAHDKWYLHPYAFGFKDLEKWLK